MLLAAEYAKEQFSNQRLDVLPIKSQQKSARGSVRNSTNRRMLDFGFASKIISKFNSKNSSNSRTSDFPNKGSSVLESANDSSSSNTLAKLTQKKSKFAVEAGKASKLISFEEISDEEE